MTVHVISVGLSVLDNLRDPRHALGGMAAAVSAQRPGELLQESGASHDKDKASQWLAAALAPPGDAAHNTAAAGRLAAMTQVIRPEKWPSEVSAEIGTYAGMPDARRPLPLADIAVLVCSDTPRGLLAGTWNAAVLTDADLSRIRYLPGPGDWPGPARGCVLQVRVPGLDAGDDRGFGQAMGGLGALGRNLLRSGELCGGEPFRFHLSGGFKAAIPYLIGLAEGLRSVDLSHPVEAIVQHETAGPGAAPIRLPLRRFIAEQVEQELSGYDSSGTRNGEPGAALLKGYAYEVSRNGKKCTLTAFGAGLRALFGLGEEWPGG
jgi:hypothetical protein